MEFIKAWVKKIIYIEIEFIFKNYHNYTKFYESIFNKCLKLENLLTIEICMISKISKIEKNTFFHLVEVNTFQKNVFNFCLFSK